MKPKKTLSVYVLLMGIMGLSIVGGILAFQIFSVSTKTQLTEKQLGVIKPIDGTISQSTIDSLEKRTRITDDDINTASNIPVSVTPTTEIPTPTPTIASPSAELEPTQ